MNDIQQQIYSKRISTLIELIEVDSPVIDVGTDHGYLPIALKQKGFEPSILAVDVNEKPLLKAAKNREVAGFTKKDIELILTDGLSNLQLRGNETIIIAGMGGFLIHKILEKDLHKIGPDNHLILQPNWTWFDLRKWLALKGFPILKEKIVEDQNKYYSVISTKYTGIPYEISDTIAFVGSCFELNSIEDYQLKYNYLLRLENLAVKKSRSHENYIEILQDIRTMLQQTEEEINET